jgi:hypothetical protein
LRAVFFLSLTSRPTLTAALKVADWIVTNTYNTLGAGGYSFGTNINQFNESVPSTNGKSTEHNIDTCAFFTMLAKMTHSGNASSGSSWSSLAQHASLGVFAPSFQIRFSVRLTQV